MNLWQPARQFYPQHTWSRGRGSANWWEDAAYDDYFAVADFNNDRYALPNLGSELLTNNSFDTAPTFGSELVTNGAFAADTDWTKVGFTISGGTANISAPGGTPTLTQAIAGLVEGDTYALTYTITLSASTLSASILGSASVNMGARAAGGTYTDYLVAPAAPVSIRFTGTATTAGTVDNVSLKRVTNAAAFGPWQTNGPGASFVSGGVALADIGGADSSITYPGLTLDFNATYQFQITFGTPTVTGSGTVRAGTAVSGTAYLNASPAINAAGTQTFYFTASDDITTGVITFIASATNASHTVESMSLKKIDTTATGRTYGPELLTNGDFATTFTLGSELLDNTGFDSAAVAAPNYGTGWVLSAGGSAISGGALVLTGDGTSNIYADQNFVTTIGDTYEITITSTSGTPNVMVGTSQGGTDNFNVASTSNSLRFVATATTTWLRLAKLTAGVVNIQSCQARPFTHPPGWILKNPNEAGEIVTIVTNVLRLTGTGTHYAYADQSFATTIGSVYQFDLALTSVSGGVAVGTSQGDTSIALTADSGLSVGTHRIIFTATSTTTWIRPRRITASQCLYDNFSVKEITAWGTHAKREATFSEFFLYTTTSDFSRTYTANDGLIHQMAEGSNMMVNPEAFNSGWTAANITFTADDASNPVNAAVTADKAALTASNTTTNRFYRSTTQGLLAGQVFTVSIYAKWGGGSATYICPVIPGGSATSYFNLTDGTHSSTLGTTAMTNEGGGWYRCSVTATLTTSSSGPNIEYWFSNRASTTPSPNTMAAGDYIHLFGAQFEYGALTAYKGGTSNTGVNAPRYTWINGRRQLRLENAGTNSAQRSQEFGSWTAANVTVTADQAVAPDGTTTMDRIDEDTASAAHGVTGVGTAVAYVSGTFYTMSVYAKSETCSTIQIVLPSGTFGGTHSYANFDLTSGTVGTAGTGVTSSIISAGSGIYRCIMTMAATGTASSNPGAVYMTTSATAARVPSYAGTDRTVLVWGYQIEAAPFATNYIPTSTATVTRAVETCRMSPFVEGLFTRDGMSYVVKGQGLEALGVLLGGDLNLTFLGTDATRANILARDSTGAVTGANVAVTGGVTGAFGAGGSFNEAAHSVAGNGGAPDNAASVITGTRATVYLGRSAAIDATDAAYGYGCYDFIGIAPNRWGDARLQARAVAV